MKAEGIALGLDPGLATTGYGIVRVARDGWEAVCGGVIETEKRESRAHRLSVIHDEACELISMYRPSGVGIEEVFLARNARTAMLTAETRGVLLLAAKELPVRGYTPLQVKKLITGYGKAGKLQVQLTVKQLLNLGEIPRPDDVADALAIALCFLLDSQGVNAHDSRST